MRIRKPLKKTMSSESNVLKEPKISIIIPVYNAEHYLVKCINSVISQSYNNFELLLINDGSTDKSLNICMEFLRKDSRVSVYNISNSGASHARNIGIDNASGDLIWFIDADDWIDEKALEILISEMKDDILFFGFKKIWSNNIESCQIIPESYTHILQIDDCLSKLFISKNAYFGYTWNKIFKKQIISDYKIRFNESLIIKEDEYFTLQYCRHINRIAISAEMPYNYRILPNSTSHGQIKKRNMLQLAEIIEQYALTLPSGSNLKNELIKENTHNYYKAIIEHIFKNDINIIIYKFIDYKIKYNSVLEKHLFNQIILLRNRYLIKFMIKHYLRTKYKLRNFLYGYNIIRKKY